MMNSQEGFTALADRIREEGRRKCEALRDKTQAEIERIEAETDVEIERALSEGRSEFQREKAELASAILSEAQWESGTSVSLQIGDAADRILDRCIKELESFVASNRFQPVLRDLLLEAAGSVQSLISTDSYGATWGEIRVSPEHVRAATMIVKENNLKLAVKSDPAAHGGVEISVSGTPYTVRNTLFARLTQSEEDMKRRIMRRLRAALQSPAALLRDRGSGLS